MSKIFCTIAICMSLIPGVSSAQQVFQMPVVCGPLDKNLEAISGYNEKPILIGKDNLHQQFDVPGLSAVVFVNKTTETFTVALMSSEQKRLCIVSSGVGIDFPNTKVKY